MWKSQFETGGSKFLGDQRFFMCEHKKAYVDKPIRDWQLQVSRRWKTYHNPLNPPCNHQRITTLNFSNFDFKISIFENLTFLAYISILSHFLMCGCKQAYVDKRIRGRQLQLSGRWKTYYNTLNPPCNHQRITTLNFSHFSFQISIFQNLTFSAYMSILSHFLILYVCIFFKI